MLPRVNEHLLEKYKLFSNQNSKTGHVRLLLQTHHTLDDLVFAVVLLHLEKVVAEVEDVKAPLLAQQGNDHAAGPVEAVTEAPSAGQEGVE